MLKYILSIVFICVNINFANSSDHFDDVPVNKKLFQMLGSHQQVLLKTQNNSPVELCDLIGQDAFGMSVNVNSNFRFHSRSLSDDLNNRITFIMNQPEDYSSRIKLMKLLGNNNSIRITIHKSNDRLSHKINYFKSLEFRIWRFNCRSWQ